MPKATSKKTTNTKPAAPVIEDETNDYDAELSKRIDTTPAPEENEAQEPTEPEAQMDETVLGELAEYVAAYPDNEVFHITSDGQVFLDKNKVDGEKHEASLGGEMKSIRVV